MKKLRSESRRTLTILRKTAIATAQLELAKSGQPSNSFSAEEALQVVANLHQTDRSLLASLWYRRATESQVKLFKREWLASVARHGQALQQTKGE